MGHHVAYINSYIVDQEDRTKEVALDLLLKCLSFDFAGTSLDESNDDLGNVQVKKKIQPMLRESKVIMSFYFRFLVHGELSMNVLNLYLLSLKPINNSLPL